MLSPGWAGLVYPLVLAVTPVLCALMLLRILLESLLIDSARLHTAPFVEAALLTNEPD